MTGRAALTAIFAALLLLSSGCSTSMDKAGGHNPRHARVLHLRSGDRPESFRAFVDKVAQLSGGDLELSSDASWNPDAPNSEVKAIRAVQAGDIDLAVVAAAAWHSVGVPDFDALLAPLEVDSVALQHAVLTSGITDRMLAGVDRLGLEGVGVLPGPIRLPGGITRPLLGPADYVGAKIAYSPGVIADRSLTALGALTGEADFLDRGGISADDGIEQDPGGVAVNQYDRVVRTITVNVGLWPRPLVVVANRKVFASLSDHDRAALRSAARAVGAATAEAHVNPFVVAPLCRRGRVELVTATTVQLRQLRARFAPVYSWLRRSASTARYLGEIDAIKRGIKPYPHETLTCAGIATSGASPSTPLPVSRSSTIVDGTYRMVTTETDERTRSDPNAGPENWGTWTFVFDRGRFAITQSNTRACTWGYGTFALHGELMEWSFIDGGGIAPSESNNKAGEHFVFRWSKYRDQLNLYPTGGPDESPGNFDLEPWRQLTRTPKASSLSKQCPPPERALIG